MERAREVQELEFLVGNACSRTITLLMQPDRDTDELQDELVFLAEKATRLAELLEGEADTSADGQ